MKVTTKTDIKEFPLLNRGKVRDIYDIDDSTLLIVTTDRMSAFDVIMNEPVPYKGVILNQITLFWMKKFAHLVKKYSTLVGYSEVAFAFSYGSGKGTLLMSKELTVYSALRNASAVDGKILFSSSW